jgi:hypothetical protein
MDNAKKSLKVELVGINNVIDEVVVVILSVFSSQCSKIIKLIYS